MFATIIRPRRAGKTAQLAQLALKNPAAVVVVHSRAEADDLVHRYGIRNTVVTFAQVKDGYLRGMSPVGAVLIDNVEFILRDALGLLPDHSDIIATATGINL